MEAGLLNIARDVKEIRSAMLVLQHRVSQTIANLEHLLFNIGDNRSGPESIQKVASDLNRKRNRSSPFSPSSSSSGSEAEELTQKRARQNSR